MGGLLRAAIGHGRLSSQRTATRACASWAQRTNPTYPTPWNKWFPYEPVPSTPQFTPYKVQVSTKEVYYWCSCGESSTQPWCESGGVKCRKCPEFAPMVYVPKFTGTKLMCGCKKSANGECFGTCIIFWADYHPFQAA